jgi:hydroxymethylbilane synthase
VASLIQGVPGAPRVKTIRIGSLGDGDRRTTISELGETGVFTKMSQHALLDGHVDVVVHSLKDLPTLIPQGLTLASVPRRESPEDVVCGSPVESWNARTVVLTGSARRAAQVRSLYPQVQARPIRGNVPTRLRRAVDGKNTATLLAYAGLHRLGLDRYITSVLDPEAFPYAVAQGAIGVEARSADVEVVELLRSIEDDRTRAEVDAERALMRELGAGCSMPVGVKTSWVGGNLRLLCHVTSIDGRRKLVDSEVDRHSSPVELGVQLGRRLIGRGAEEILHEARALSVPAL